MARDPFSWAEDYNRQMTDLGSRNEQNAQNALMQIFVTEAARQRPWSDLPVDLAKQNNAAQNALTNAYARADYTAQQKAAERLRMPPDKIAKLITDNARAFGVDEDIMLTIAGIESNFNPAAKNPKSTAGGLWQQLDSNAKTYGVTNKFDPVDSTRGAMQFATTIQRTLQQAGLPVDAGTMYLAWQQGPQGAVRLLSNPNAPAESIVGREAVIKNGGRPGMTAGAFANMWMNKARRQYEQRKKLRAERRGSGETVDERLAALETKFTAPDGVETEIED